MTLKRAVRRISTLVGVGLVVAAVVTELRKPAGQRNWQGQVAGVVPYNFRPAVGSGTRPEPGPGKRDKVLVPRSFGVGWSVNFPAVVRNLQGRRVSPGEQNGHR